MFSINDKFNIWSWLLRPGASQIASTKSAPLKLLDSMTPSITYTNLKDTKQWYVIMFLLFLGDKT